MNKIVKLFTFFILICSIHTAYPNPSIISKFYCLVLGNKDARPEYKQLAYQALKDLGIEKPEDVPVKQMNGIGPKFALLDLGTFTAFGIWLDEKYLDKCSEEEKTFHIYHEASHYVQNHHFKLLAGCGVALAGMVAGLVKLSSELGQTNPMIKDSAIVGIGLLLALGSYRYLLPYFVKRQEKQADLMATDKLIGTQNEAVVDTYIAQLKKYKSSEDDLWWYSNQEIVEYLENLKAKKGSNHAS